MTRFFKKLFQDEDGATAVEYALMIALIAAVVIGAVRLLGSTTSDSFTKFTDAFNS